MRATKTITLKELGDLVEKSYDPMSLQHDFHLNDMFDHVVVPANELFESYYLPFIFKTHLPLFSHEMIALGLLKLHQGCAKDIQEGRTALSRISGGWMSSEQSKAILTEIIDKNLIFDHFDTPKSFISEIGKIENAGELEVINHLMRASHTRYALLNNTDRSTAASSEISLGNQHVLQEFVLNNTKKYADPIIVNASTIALWNTNELFAQRATEPNNKNMSIVFTNFSTANMEANVIFYDEHDFKNWLYYHRRILRRVMVKDSIESGMDTIAFAADLLEAIDENDNYDEFTPMAMVISALGKGNVTFIDDPSNFKNKLKLMGSTTQFINRFINSGD